jgi:transcription elongation factor SPT5
MSNFRNQDFGDASDEEDDFNPAPAVASEDEADDNDADEGQEDAQDDSTHDAQPNTRHSPPAQSDDMDQDTAPPSRRRQINDDDDEDDDDEEDEDEDDEDEDIVRLCQACTTITSHANLHL